MKLIILKHLHTSTATVWQITDQGTEQLEGPLGLHIPQAFNQHSLTVVNEADAYNPKLFVYHTFITDDDIRTPPHYGPTYEATTTTAKDL